uniref:Uncharacterized protein n=1 Tax=Cajanus cajan TaxID=3821 RepID=A0A151TYS8_CAJCA|nr:hypothetical protein KK1_004816 [Cajanus cajan]
MLVVSYNHIFREANKVVDALARNSLSSQEDIVLFNFSPRCIHSLLQTESSAAFLD